MSEKKKQPVKKKRATKNQFKKGVSGNPFGRPKMSKEEKELSLKSRSQFRTILQKYMITSEAELMKLYKNKQLPVLDGMVVKSLVNAFKSGDQSQINWFLDHCLGKVKETKNINLTGSMENKQTQEIDLSKLSEEDLENLHAIAKKNES